MKLNWFNDFEMGEENNLTPDFLAEQIKLPREQWDERFRRLIEQKTKENQEIRGSKLGEKVENNEIPEEEEVKRYQSYLEMLDLKEEELRNKRVLDLGCGERGYFIRHLLKEGITQEAYGIDLEISQEVSNYRNHFYQGDFQQEFPLNEVDYIVSVGAVSNAVYGERVIMEIKKILANCLHALKKGGEIRIYPIMEAAAATPLGFGSKHRKIWEEFLVKISQELDIEYEIKPRNIEVVGKDNDIVLYSVLIIRRKTR